jgi:hypothetical protein
MIKIDPDIIRARVIEYLTTTPKTIVSCEEILWTFPEMPGRRGKCDLDIVHAKRNISNLMRGEFGGQWEIYRGSKNGGRKIWKRREVPIEIQPTVKTCKPKATKNPREKYPFQLYDTEPWGIKLKRYREVFENLVVVNNGGYTIKPEEVKA